MKLFQINEDDLAELERTLPQMADDLDAVQAQWPQAGPRIRKQITRVKEILSNVRWDYHPHAEVTEIPAGNPEPPNAD